MYHLKNCLFCIYEIFIPRRQYALWNLVLHDLRIKGKLRSIFRRKSMLCIKFWTRTRFISIWWPLATVRSYMTLVNIFVMGGDWRFFWMGFLSFLLSPAAGDKIPLVFYSFDKFISSTECQDSCLPVLLDYRCRMPVKKKTSLSTCPNQLL